MSLQEAPPEPPKKWPPYFRDYMVKLVDYVTRQRPLAGVGVTVSDASGGGKQINAIPIGGTVPTTIKHPFLVVDATDKNGPKVRVYSGIVNSMSISDGPFNIGDNPPLKLVVSNGSKIYIFVNIAFDGSSGTWSASGYGVAAAGSLPNASSILARYEIGTVAITDGVMSIGGGVVSNAGWKRCGYGDSLDDQWYAAV